MQFLARAITASAVSSSEESPSPSASVFYVSEDHKCKAPGWLLTCTVCSCTAWPDQRLYLRSTHLLQGQHLHCARGCGRAVIVGFTSPAPFLHPFSSLQSLWLSMSWQQHSKLARFTAPTCCVVYSITVDSANVASFDLHPVGVTTPCLKLSHLCQVL